MLSHDVIGAVIPRANPRRDRFKPKLDITPRPKKKQRAVRSVRTIGKRRTVDTEDIRRERSRANQAIYRRTQETLIVSLEEVIANLQQDIQKLGIWRQNIGIETPKTLDLWFAATEYFRLFQIGFKAPPPGLRACLSKIMASDVTGPICGVDALVKNWTLLSLSFEDINVELECLDRTGDDSLVATTWTSITIRSETLRRVFPHLLERDCNSLATKLQGQRIVMRTSVHFDWDNSTKCIVRMRSQSGMLSPILHLLGNLQDVSRVFDGALVTPEFRLRAA